MSAVLTHPEITIENVRLFDEVQQRTNELRQRTDDLSEALEQQTATSEVLQVISRSPGELEPVFQAMLENATRICEAVARLVTRHHRPPQLAASFSCRRQTGT